MNETRRSYDAVAQQYAAEIGDELLHKPLDRAMLAVLVELSSGGILLDAGCGPGHVAAHLASLGATVVAADLSPAMCAIAARTGLPVTCGDLTALPFADSSLSAIACLYAVIHLDAQARAAAYAEFARVLRPGGHALVSFHTSDATTPMGGELAMTQWWGHDIDLSFRYLDPAGEVELLAAAGLTLRGRLDRSPDAETEHASQRSSLLVRRD